MITRSCPLADGFHDVVLAMLTKVFESNDINTVPRCEFIYAMPNAPIIVEY
ncbi:MAG: hypothetical protein IK100_09110 [Muribaculaceae bacterium]|nr:hypothetical protein [Muribaculaceae bacterium]